MYSGSLVSYLEKLSWEKEEKKSLQSPSQASSKPASPPQAQVEASPEPVTSIGHYLVPVTALQGVETNSAVSLNTATGEKLSCRVYDLKFFRSKEVLFSIGHGKGVHPMKEVLLTESRVFVFSGSHHGDLHQYLREKKRLSEVEAAPLFRQIVELVRDCHSRGIALRDIKLKKFVFEDGARSTLSLHYLDDAQLMEASGLLSDRHGCPAYVCPEMLQPGSYSGPAADLWSLGVILYTLLVGHYPFFDISTQNLFSKVRCGYYQVPDHVSELARSVIASLLAYEPSSRVPAWKILEHLWFRSAQDETFTAVLSQNSLFLRSKDQTVPDP